MKSRFLHQVAPTPQFEWDNSEYPWQDEQGAVTIPCEYNFPNIDDWPGPFFRRPCDNKRHFSTRTCRPDTF